MEYIVLGRPGSDAGYTVIVNGVPRHVGGWGVESLAEVTTALAIMREATHLKTPGLAEAAIKVVSEFVTKELSAHIREGAAVVIIT